MNKEKKSEKCKLVVIKSMTMMFKIFEVVILMYEVISPKI
jgi:hypothetical protein